jgi:hypothetical protein
MHANPNDDMFFVIWITRHIAEYAANTFLTFVGDSLRLIWLFELSPIMRFLDEFNIIHMSFSLFGIEIILYEKYEIVYHNKKL